MEPIKLNLATFEYQDKRILYPIMLLATLAVLVISSLSITIGMNTQSEIKEYENKILERKQQVVKRQQIKKENFLRMNDTEIEALKKDVDFINGLITLDAYPYDRLLDSLELCIPQRVALINLQMSKDLDKVTLEGKADSMNDVNIFLNKLNDSKIYKNNNLLNLAMLQENPTQEETKSMDVGIRFEIICSISKDQLGL